MARRDFISDNLVHMRERLKENTAKMAAEAEAAQVRENEEEAEIVSAPKLSVRKITAPPATTHKTDDAIRRKREFAEKLERDRATVAAALEMESIRIDELRKFQEALAELDQELRQLGAGNSAEELRELEKLCFSHHRAAGRASVFLTERSSGPIQPTAPETRGFRHGFAESLPLLATLVLSALIVAATLILLF